MARPVRGNADEIARRLAEHNERVATRQASRGRFNPAYTHPSMRGRGGEDTVEEDVAPRRSESGGNSGPMVLKLRDLLQRALMELDDYAPQKAMEFRRELKGMS